MAMSRSFGVRSLTTRSPILISPSLISSRPASIRSAVVLPQPEGPTRTISSPSPMSRSNSWTARVPSGYTFATASYAISAIGLAFCHERGGARRSQADAKIEGARSRVFQEEPSPMPTEPGKIRNVAVTGHRGTGKTSLVEAMLFQAGAINRLGTVEAGTTTSDWDEDEQ